MIGMEFLSWIASGRIPSGWVIDIWNCHGVVKPKKFAGYGSMSDEMLEEFREKSGKEYIWFNCGYYTTPLRKDIYEVVKKAGLDEELRERLEKVLNWIVYEQNGGAINFSGFYMISVDELEALETTIQRVTLRAMNKLNEPAAYEVLSLLFS